MDFVWKGVMPAMSTKFEADGSLDIPLFLKNVDAQIDAGATGLILAGSLGEASTLSQEEKSILTQHTVRHVLGRVPIIVNIAERSTQEAIKMAKQAEEDGASGLMLLPPMQYKADSAETTAYILAVAQSTPLPIMLYNNPIDYGIAITLDMLEICSKQKNIAAIKESSRDVTQITRIKNRFGNRFAILTGVDTLAMESMVLGADGWVAGLVCAFPRETVALYQWASTGDLKNALALQRWFLPLLELDVHSKLVQNIKLAETYTGLGSENLRAPRLPLSGAERERVKDIIEQSLKNRPEVPHFGPAVLT